MEHWARIIMDKVEDFSLNEQVFPVQEHIKTEQDCSVIQIPLPRELDEQESDEYASRLADCLFEMGFQDFDIEITTGNNAVEEETLDGDEFYEQYGVIGYVEEDQLWEAEYRGRKVKLNKPIRSKDGPKKFHVYVRDPKTKNIKKVNFGDPNMEIKRDNPKRRRSFRARHNCDNPGPKTKARYWSCRAW